MDEVIEQMAEKMHEDWRDKKSKAGVASRPDAVTGEELMVPYAHLSEAGKDLNREPARGAIKTLTDLGYRIEK
jgi:hypothetical protein